MRLIKKARFYLVTLWLLVFTAGSAQAGRVIEEWVACYNGPGNNIDEVCAITLDGSGNIHVTGQSYGFGTNSDYTTIKYAQCLSPLAGDLNAENWLECNWSNPEICW